MRIGIELRLLAGQMTGIGNHSFHLMKALIDTCPKSSTAVLAAAGHPSMLRQSESSTSARTKARPRRIPVYGKADRPRSFRNLDDLNAQLRHWLEVVANPRVHATTQRVVNEAFADEAFAEEKGISKCCRWHRSARSLGWNAGSRMRTW
jgi:hypothetical protein